MQRCLFCGHTVQFVHVHGHYQCPVCTTNALPCCDGDNCDTNLLLNEPLTGTATSTTATAPAEKTHTTSSSAHS